jgi:vacuolar-type H+-ATPase subunit E/Vma4
MALEDIKNKIMKDANAQKDKMIDEAKSRKSQILGDYKKKVDDYRKTMMERADNEGETIKRGIVIDARQSVKNSVLHKKRGMINEVSLEAVKKFCESSDYPAFMAKLVKKSVVTKEEEIIVSKNDKKLDSKWLDGINKELKSKLTVSKEKGDFLGGVIVKNDRVFVNITMETLLSVMAEDVEKEIANILF